MTLMSVGSYRCMKLPKRARVSMYLCRGGMLQTGQVGARAKVERGNFESSYIQCLE